MKNKNTWNSDKICSIRLTYWKTWIVQQLNQKMDLKKKRHDQKTTTFILNWTGEMVGSVDAKSLGKSTLLNGLLNSCCEWEWTLLVASSLCSWGSWWPDTNSEGNSVMSCVGVVNSLGCEDNGIRLSSIIEVPSSSMVSSRVVHEIDCVVMVELPELAEWPKGPESPEVLLAPLWDEEGWFCNWLYL